MKEPSERAIQKVMEWMAYADDDLRLAVHTMDMPPKDRPSRLIAYHAQQCAEKYLKAYLVYRGVDFPYTHNISLLLEVCGKLATWPTELQDAKELSAYAITTRYPGIAKEVTAEEAQRTIDLAQQVRTRVRAALHELGIRLSGEEPSPDGRAESE